MNCEEVRRRMLDRALEELPAEEIRSLEEHIRGCAACAQAWEEISATHALLAHHLVEAEVPRHFRLTPTEVPASVWARLWAPALRAGLAAGVALVMLVASLATFGVSFARENGNYRLAFGRERAAVTTVSRAEIDQAVNARLGEAERRLAAQQRDELARLTAGLDLANARDVRRLGQRVEWLQSAQNQMWKETQRSQYLVELVASNALARAGEAPK